MTHALSAQHFSLNFADSKFPMNTRQATTKDIPFLLILRRQTMDAHLLASGVDVSDDYHLDRVLYRFECAKILLNQTMPVGLLKVDRGSTEWEIIQIQLAAELQGQGKGRIILGNLIRESIAAGARIKLSVLKANPAKHLYDRLGFTVIGEDAHEYFMVRIG